MKKIKKRSILSVMLCIMMLFTMLNVPAVSHAETPEDQNYRSDAYALWMNNKAAPVEPGKVFAGWYQDAAYENPVRGEEDFKDGGAYAKFVDEKALTVKFQLRAGTGPDSENTDLRMLTTVDSLKYQSVGFDIKVKEKEVEAISTRVYSQISWYLNAETGGMYTPKETFCSESQYFMAYKLAEIPKEAFNEHINITPKWTTLDGTTVTGTPKTVCIAYAVLPTVSDGVVSFDGNAESYNIYVGNTKIGTTTEKTFDTVHMIVDALGDKTLTASADHSYSVRIESVGNQIVYMPVSLSLKAVTLTQDNFVTELSSSSADTYYVLTENITVSTEYQADKRTTANGKYEDAIVYAPVAEFHGILDGQGHKISVEYGGGAKIDGGWEVFGGLFGYTQDAVIQNVNLDFTAQLNGHVIKVLPGGVMTAVLGSNTTIQNCFINSVINVWNQTDVGGIGAIAGKLFGGTSGCVIKNNVVSSKIVLNGVQQDSPDRLIADVGENIQMNGNAYIINRTLPAVFDDDNKLHDEAFMAWGVDANDNWLFETLSDFLIGGVGHKCTYHGATNWSREWALSQTPSEALYKSEAWSGTTFDYNETNGLTLCGKQVSTEK